MMAQLRIEPDGALVSGDGRMLAAGRDPRWLLVLHGNASEISVALDEGQHDQHPLLIMPKRAENLFSLLADTVEEELELTFVLRGMPVDRAALLQLAADIGLEPVLADRPEDLSGGQKARLALAVLLLRSPATLVLDNALEAIDEGSRDRVAKMLRCAVDSGTRVIELGATTPLQPSCVDQAFIESEQGWVPAGPEDVLAWGQAWEVPPRWSDFRQARGADVVLHCRDVEFHYEGGFRLLAPEIDVLGGQVTWIVGPNGAGKTTLLKCLALLLRPHRGKLGFRRGNRTLDVNFTSPEPTSEPVHHFALYQFQDPDDQIYCESVAQELVATAKHCHGVDKDRVDRYARQLDLSTRLGDSPWDLHRSARRLLTLGSVLCATPAVALLDEPTVGLDTQQKLAMAEALLDFTASGGACVVVSHDSRFMQAIAAARIHLSSGNVSQDRGEG